MVQTTPSCTYSSRNSHLAIEDKLLLYKAIVKLVRPYSIHLCRSASNTSIMWLKRFQSKTLRSFCIAPWYVRDRQINCVLFYSILLLRYYNLILYWFYVLIHNNHFYAREHLFRYILLWWFCLWLVLTNKTLTLYNSKMSFKITSTPFASIIKLAG